MNAQKKNLFNKIAVLALVALLGGNMISPVSALASEVEVAEAEIIYYDEFIYEDGLYQGQGTRTAVDYTIYCDEMVIEDGVARPSAPSYGNNDPSITNACGPVAGTNIVVYYDRWATNLIPNFDPGMISYGTYTYFPDLDWPQTITVIESLYNLMKVPEVGGTTSANFKSGLNSYVTGQGYSVSYTSCYNSATTLNLTTLKTAINAGKVALLMCSQYNFIYEVNDATATTGTVYYTQFNSTVGHMMMVYGYKTLGYYNDGVKVGEDTFLLVSSGYSSEEQGYMRLNAFSVIDEAWVMYIY